VKIPGWARSLWRPGVKQPKKEKAPRPRRRERELYGERRGLLAKRQAIRLASARPHKTQTSARR
jgi:hypothetical protein